MQVEVYADVVCPWCYIGEARLNKALALRPDLKVEKVWRPFQLRPELPPEGENWTTFAIEKFGGLERAQSMFNQVATVGKDDGLDFRFDKVASAANTLDAHRIILLAADEGKTWETAHNLMKAYFTEGRNLSHKAELTAIAIESGLTPRKVEDLLETDYYEDEVVSSQETATELGINGVPFFIFNGKYALSGAQPVEVFLKALDLAASDNLVTA
jgi:predicted DsbA family dithiol-disulfide isomerase